MFFVGVGESKEEDVMSIPCEDNYQALPDKVLGMVAYARMLGYDYILKIDDDVYVRPERIEVPTEDYVGQNHGHKEFSSGATYWLSARAMDTILANWCRRTNSEDVCVGETLKRQGIFLTKDHRYRIGWRSLKKDVGENEFPNPTNDTITFHMYWPQFMPQMHANWTSVQLVDANNFCGRKTD